MKKKLILGLIAGGLAASSALAIPQSGTVTITEYLLPNEFTITAVSPTSFATFQSFCLERNTPNGVGPETYVLNTGAVLGGPNAPDGTPGFDPISKGTAWLFRQFADGTLPGFTFAIGATRAQNALDLQDAIWYLEDEWSLVNPGAATFLNEAEAALGLSSWDDLKWADNGAQGVYAMNLEQNGVLMQDMLTVPDGGTALALLGFAMVCVEGLRRKLAK